MARDRKMERSILKVAKEIQKQNREIEKKILKLTKQRNSRK